MTAGSRRWWSIGLAVAVTAGLVTTAVLLRRPAPVPAAQEAPATTATITRGTLIDVQTFPGQLAYGPEHDSESRLSGTVTAIPAVGSTVKRGGTLFRIDDSPVVLMYGAVPAYRTLTAGHKAKGTSASATATDPSPDPSAPAVPATPAVPRSIGADVKEFETNLRALGYSGFTVDDVFDARTAAAVKRWQRDLGVPVTGDVELGRVYYASGAVRVARQKLAPGVLASGAVLSYTGTARLVTATLQAHNQALAKVGATVTVQLSNGKSVRGVVTSVGTPSNDQSAADQEPTLDVVVRLTDPGSVSGLDDGPARVSFVAQQRTDVLYVPVGALLALSEGGYGLQIVDGGHTRIVAVTTGLFASGNVEVSGPGITAGMTVGAAR